MGLSRIFNNDLDEAYLSARRELSSMPLVIDDETQYAISPPERSLSTVINGASYVAMVVSVLKSGVFSIYTLGSLGLYCIGRQLQSSIDCRERRTKEIRATILLKESLSSYDEKKSSTADVRQVVDKIVDEGVFQKGAGQVVAECILYSLEESRGRAQRIKMPTASQDFIVNLYNQLFHLTMYENIQKGLSDEAKYLYQCQLTVLTLNSEKMESEAVKTLRVQLGEKLGIDLSPEGVGDTASKLAANPPRISEFRLLLQNLPYGLGRYFR